MWLFCALLLWDLVSKHRAWERGRGKVYQTVLWLFAHSGSTIRKELFIGHNALKLSKNNIVRAGSNYTLFISGFCAVFLELEVRWRPDRKHISLSLHRSNFARKIFFFRKSVLNQIPFLLHFFMAPEISFPRLANRDALSHKKGARFFQKLPQLFQSQAYSTLQLAYYDTKKPKSYTITCDIRYTRTTRMFFTASIAVFKWKSCSCCCCSSCSSSSCDTFQKLASKQNKGGAF